MKIYKTKTGQPYIKLANGRARFIKKKSSTRSLSIKRKTKSKRSYTMAKKKKSYKKSSGMLGKLNRPLTGAVGVVMYESFLSPLIPLQGVAKDLLELSAGYYLSKKRGVIGATGQSLMVINSYQLLSGLVGNKLSGLLGASSPSEYSY